MPNLIALKSIQPLLDAWNFKGALEIIPTLDLLEGEKRRLRTLIHKDEKQKLDNLYHTLKSSPEFLETIPELVLFNTAVFTSSQPKTCERIQEIKEYTVSQYVGAIQTLQEQCYFKEAELLIKKYAKQLPQKDLERLNTQESRTLRQMEVGFNIAPQEDEADVIEMPALNALMLSFERMTVSSTVDQDRLRAIIKAIHTYKRELEAAEKNTNGPTSSSWSASLWSMMGFDSSNPATKRPGLS